MAQTEPRARNTQVSEISAKNVSSLFMRNIQKGQKRIAVSQFLARASRRPSNIRTLIQRCCFRDHHQPRPTELQSRAGRSPVSILLMRSGQFRYSEASSSERNVLKKSCIEYLRIILKNISRLLDGVQETKEATKGQTITTNQVVRELLRVLPDAEMVIIDEKEHREAMRGISDNLAIAAITSYRDGSSQTEFFWLILTVARK